MESKRQPKEKENQNQTLGHPHPCFGHPTSPSLPLPFLPSTLCAPVPDKIKTKHRSTPTLASVILPLLLSHRLSSHPWFCKAQIFPLSYLTPYRNQSKRTQPQPKLAKRPSTQTLKKKNPSPNPKLPQCPLIKAMAWS